MALAKLPAEIISIEFLNVHYRGEVFSGEPTTALALVVSADVAGVAARSVASCASKPGRFSMLGSIATLSVTTELKLRSEKEKPITC